jgi:pseudaminic acid biosynthesis-associated methylase
MNEQEKFWKGSFGNSYIKRNQKKLIKNNFILFKKIFNKVRLSKINSIIEFGANIGNNLHALKKLKKNLSHLTAVEINKNACKILKKDFKNIKIINKPIVKFRSSNKYNLTIVKGILIHINPKDLNKIYKIIFDSSNKYILIAEYYSQKPVKIDYRGFKNKLFKRDFAGEFLKKFEKTKLLDYGFAYHKDKYPQDDINWFLISKK